MRKIFFVVLFLAFAHTGLSISQGAQAPPFFQGELRSPSAQEDILSLFFDLARYGKATLLTKVKRGEKFDLSAKLEHLKLGAVDLFATIESSGEFIMHEKNTPAFIQGRAFIRNLLLNNKPADDLDVYYEILSSHNVPSSYIFKIPYLKWGRCLGYVEIHLGQTPYLDLFLTINHADVTELGAVFDLKRLSEFCPLLEDCQEGTINGQIEIRGPFKNPYIIGRLEVDYFDKGQRSKKAVINFRGVYPWLEIEDSFLKEGDETVFSMRGSFKLDQLKRKNWDEELEYFIRPQDTNSVVILTDKSPRSKIRLNNEDIFVSRVGLTNYYPEDRSVSFRGNEDSIEFEHGLKDRHKALKMYMTGSGEEIIGWEHKVRF